ncbi:hypothetical protein [Paenibacillus taiwanensis]|uniref:hypothetical protein n=1 Tax=Paenibacillus taiwanensis TaxID=401638 RepID=UPI0006845F80|nr:hypothetical protein [Paenibacillus taiwanensis]
MRKLALLTMTAVVLLCTLFSVPSYAELNVDAADSKVNSELDSTVMDQVKAAVKQVAPDNNIKPDIHVIVEDRDGIKLEGELSQPAAKFSIFYDKKKQRVNHTSVYYQIQQQEMVLDDALQNKITNFKKTFEDKKYPFKFDSFWRIKSPYQDNEPRNYWVFWGVDQALEIDLDKGNRITAHQSFSLKQIDAKLLAKATKAINQLNYSDKIDITYVSRMRNEQDGSFFWYFYDRYEHNYIKIGVLTNKVWEAEATNIDWFDEKDFAKSFAKPKYSPTKAISIASVSVKALFNVNLTGYKVKVKLNEYTFTRDKQATIIGKINKKGQFYSLKMIPSAGALIQ